MDLPCNRVHILNEVTSVQIQTTKQVNLGTKDKFRDCKKKAAILDLKKNIFERASMTILNVYLIVFNKTSIAL